MSVMSFADFLQECMRIRYRRDAGITNFGDPMNCYGFIYWYYRMCCGIELERSVVNSFDDIVSVRYINVDVPTNGDVVDLHTLGGEHNHHVGIYMNGYVHHFGYCGPEAKAVSRIPHLIKGYYHVVED